jgi:large conductance mechanosensitive channel
MPPIGFVLKGVNFRDLAIVLQRDPEGNPVAAIGYGAFLQNALEFVIIAFAVFLLVQAINRLRKRYEQGKEVISSPPPPPSEEVLLLREIRDALNKKDKKAL